MCSEKEIVGAQTSVHKAGGLSRCIQPACRNKPPNERGCIGGKKEEKRNKNSQIDSNQLRSLSS